MPVAGRRTKCSTTGSTRVVDAPLAYQFRARPDSGSVAVAAGDGTSDRPASHSEACVCPSAALARRDADALLPLTRRIRMRGVPALDMPRFGWSRKPRDPSLTQIDPHRATASTGQEGPMALALPVHVRPRNPRHPRSPAAAPAIVAWHDGARARDRYFVGAPWAIRPLSRRGCPPPPCARGSAARRARRRAGRVGISAAAPAAPGAAPRDRDRAAVRRRSPHGLGNGQRSRTISTRSTARHAGIGSVLATTSTRSPT